MKPSIKFAMHTVQTRQDQNKWWRERGGLYGLGAAWLFTCMVKRDGKDAENVVTVVLGTTPTLYAVTEAQRKTWKGMSMRAYPVMAVWDRRKGWIIERPLEKWSTFLSTE